MKKWLGIAVILLFHGTGCGDDGETPLNLSYAQEKARFDAPTGTVSSAVLKDLATEIAELEHLIAPLSQLFVAYPDRPEYIDRWAEYLYGPDILVRPVWEVGIDSVHVHLPAGAWIDAWAGIRYKGPTDVTIDAPLHVIPIFVREGGSVDLGDLPAKWRRAMSDVVERPDLAELAKTVH